MKYSQKDLGKSQIEIDVELATEEFEAYRPKAVAELAQSLRVEGFRPGHVPAAIAARELAETNVLEEMARQAISETYRTIVQEQNLPVIGDPTVEIRKIAANNPFEFRVKVAVVPEVQLPDYKESAGQVARKQVQVEEKEIDEALTWLQQSRKAQDSSTLELSDEFAQSLGNFANLAALREGVKEGLQQEKEMKETERLRQEIVEKIAEKSQVAVPEVLVEREKAVLLDNVKRGVAEVMQMEFAEYLQKSGKSEQELLDSFAKEAEQRVKRFLVLREVAKKEGIEPTKEEVEQEANQILNHYASAKKAQKEIDPVRLKEYTEGVIRHEKTLQFLEQFASPNV
ncbi:MAG TPA: trigger factor [Candidatus Paceibacterota bacterium]|nr:trigger factor [Candidatus Paceibacterota bacterium]